MGSQHAERRRAIESALLDFHRAPGRHAPALRQPPLLFASVREVLLMAGGRSGEEGSPAPAAAVVQAARFFVRAALLRPDADHYALLGLPRTTDAAAIKERYRSLMRLTHPDFAQSSAHAGWPADGATRINQAYEILSSPERRRAYDEATAPTPNLAAPAPLRAVKSAPVGRNVTRAVTSRRNLPRLAAGFGALGGLALVGLWLSGEQGERDTLVQRATTRIDKLPALFAAATPPRATEPAAAATTAPLPPAIERPLPTTVVPELNPAATSTTALAKPIVDAPVSPPPVAPASATRAAPVDAPAAAPAAVAAPAPAPAPPSGPTMAAVQQPLTQLLQEIESGWGDNVIALLDSRARRSSAAQAVARELDALCEGVRPVKIARVDFKGEPRDGHLVVNGVVMLQVRDAAAPTRQFALQADFVAQDGSPVLTRLAPLASP
jgi:DnaJ-domain-containing protein 1